VSLPLTESQRYDLVIDNGQLCRVEIKTTTYQRNNHYVALIKTNGGNRSGTGKTTLFDPTAVDFLFVWTPDGCYEFPANEVGCTGTLALNQSRDKYRVSLI
jgi:hypothetical protein